MKNIKVELLHFTPSDVIINAVGMPYKSKNPTIETATKVIAKLNHTSVAEHCVMSFKISGISRLNMQELSRHRISSTTASSTRYTLFQLLNEFGHIENIENDLEDCEEAMSKIISDNFVIPERPDYVKDNNDWNLFITTLKTNNRKCLHYMNYYKKLGFKADVLKYILTENFRISLVWTINLRSLLNFFNLRLDKSAHFEIRHLAGLIKSQICRVPYIKNIIKQIDDTVLESIITSEQNKIKINWNGSNGVQASCMRSW